jgi:hypothetical protein
VGTITFPHETNARLGLVGPIVISFLSLSSSPCRSRSSTRTEKKDIERKRALPELVTPGLTGVEMTAEIPDLAGSGAQRGSGGASGGEEENLGVGVRVAGTGEGHGSGGA